MRRGSNKLMTLVEVHACMRNWQCRRCCAVSSLPALCGHTGYCCCLIQWR